MARVLSTEYPHSFETAIAFTKAGHDFFAPKEEISNVHEFDRAALIQTIKDLKVDVLLVGLRFKIDREILDLGIKIVATRTTNITDHIDYKYCEEKNIKIINLSGEELGDVVAVPELIFWAMLELIRKRGGQELKGKTLGIIGSDGRIAKILAGYAGMDEHSFGMNILTYDIKIGGDLNNLLQKSDVVSLNISSVEANRNFMNKKMFEIMKDGAYFLNSTRPWLVETEAFKWAMENKLAGAWVDFDLGWTAENLIQTNHIGGKTPESALKTEAIITHKLISWLSK